MSAMLVFMALILCLALIVICIVSTLGQGSLFDPTPAPAPLNDKSTGDLWRLHAATIAFVLHDLTLGCGVFTTISSFTKIGYNPVPSANYICLTDLIIAAVAFVSLMAIVVNMQHTTGVSNFDLVRKTQNAPAYFVIFPAALDRVAASNRFDFFNFLAMSFFTPLVVFLESVSIGWVNDTKLQSNVAGERAVKIYAVVCFSFTALFCVVSIVARDVIFIPVIILVAVNAITAAVVAAAVRDARASDRYLNRVKALYVGNMEIWQEQVMRVTLFNHPPVPAIAWLGAVARMFCGCCLSRTRPLFLYRISLFWGITMKHLVPSAMIYLVVQGMRDFPEQWYMMRASPGMRICGVLLVLLAFLLFFSVPFIPKLKWWVCPPPEDYMPISMFPLHTYHPPPRVTFCQAVSHLFKEFSSSSRHTSPHLIDLVSDYKRHQLVARRGTTAARGTSEYLATRPGRRYSSLRESIIGTGFDSGVY
ncbi:sodium:neurotransmitter symporter family protein [Cystoisospora suis]|uniref:Sodium:neurotransmitter symporter family protein n=1 Tax=Cystoisospora suis TaxID=483139 RepID=A0A2C6LC53_9APIC|nr:sodium:neurotransmitter symporter family protein [Cystoisospora suis]